MTCGIFICFPAFVVQVDLGENTVRVFAISSMMIVWLLAAAAAPLTFAEETYSDHSYIHLPLFLGKTTVTFHSPTTLEQLAAIYTTPESIAAFLRKRCTFVRDETLFGTADYWQAPEELAVRRMGDCEDYALLARELLQRNSIEAFVFSLFGDRGYAHTVSVFVEDGRYNIINQDKVYYYRAPSLEAVASSLYQMWTFGGITERRGTRGRMVIPLSRRI